MGSCKLEVTICDSKPSRNNRSQIATGSGTGSYGKYDITIRRGAVRRNPKRFPPDFVFQLTKVEHEDLRCQIGISNSRGSRRHLPYAFNEHGAIMTANVFHSPEAVRTWGHLLVCLKEYSERGVKNPCFT